MNIELKNKLSQMEKYKEQCKDIFRWDNGVIKYIAAIIFAGMDADINKDKIAEMKKLINENTNRFSAFRNSFQPLLCILLSVEDNPEELFMHMKELAQLFKQEKIVNNAYTSAACYYIARNSRPEDYKNIVICFKQLYKGIKKEYPLITGIDDYMYFAIMAMQGLNVKDTIERLENITKQLQVCGMKRDELQALAMAVLLLERDDDNLIQKVIAMNNNLTERGISLKSDGMSPDIAVLAELAETDNDIVDELIETVEYIKGLDGYGDEYIDDMMRNVIAILFLTYGSKCKVLVVLQTLCVMVLMMSCSSSALSL
ncbi:MAG: DUF4003 family protein [Coprococcus sp.]